MIVIRSCGAADIATYLAQANSSELDHQKSPDLGEIMPDYPRGDCEDAMGQSG